MKMLKSVLCLVLTVLTSFDVMATPITRIFKETTPDGGETIIAISASSDLNMPRPTRYRRPHEGRSSATFDASFFNVDQLKKLLNFGLPGAPAGEGRAFVSASPINPFVLPMFNLPSIKFNLDLSGLGLGDLFKSVQPPSFEGMAAVNTVTAVNDNGHIHGNVNSVGFDNYSQQ